MCKSMIWRSIKPNIQSINPLTPIGSPVTHENWPMNWPNFAASPALLGWPARNRHTAACIHRFSHILRWPPEPVVWFMSESRAVANEHKGYKRTLPIISSSFWMAVGVKGLTNIIFSFEKISSLVVPVICKQPPPLNASSTLYGRLELVGWTCWSERFVHG